METRRRKEATYTELLVTYSGSSVKTGVDSQQPCLKGQNRAFKLLGKVLYMDTLQLWNEGFLGI